MIDRSAPRWIPDAPRFALLDGPSPLQPLPRFSAAVGHGLDVWIKREDLLPLAFGGNKLRNLEFIIGAALAEGADTLVTSGRRWSNHCRLTAAAGARAGLAVHLVLTGPAGSDAGANERLEAILGATVHVTSTDAREERATTVTEVATALREAGRRPFIIDVGGTGAIGALGQVLAGIEVAEQAGAAGIEPRHLIVPTATGGTQAGLLAGLALAGSRANVIGVAVAHPADDLRPVVARLAAELATIAPVPGEWQPRIVVEDGYLGAGYGRPDPRAEAAASLLARTEGILVDPIYTAKALTRVVEDPGSLGDGAIVFWHAGGTPALFETLVP